MGDLTHIRETLVKALPAIPWSEFNRMYRLAYHGENPTRVTIRNHYQEYLAGKLDLAIVRRILNVPKHQAVVEGE